MSGLDPGDPADHHPAVPARVADLAAEEGSRHAEAAELRRAVLARYLRTTIITTLMVACSYGAAFGAIQQIPQIVPGLPGSEDGRAGSQDAGGRDKLAQARRRQAQDRREDSSPEDSSAPSPGNYTLSQEIGGLIGRFLLALLVVRIVSRRSLIRIFQVPGLILMPVVFAFCTLHNQETR